MHYFELDAEENELLHSVENDEWVSVPNKDEKIAQFASAARNTLGRSKNINIRLSERDLMKLKSKASEKGIPYQTLVASILHQYGNKV
jgi:predicted DNA binding CopG/RHH family protein